MTDVGTFGQSSHDISNEDLAKQVLSALNGRTLATAESLTGGLIGATITAIPGASTMYRGGVITYASDLKASMLDIPPATMAHGVVSKEVAAAMAVGVAYFLNAEFAIATTGVAGPDSQENQTPGTVFVSVFRRGRDGAPVSVTEKYFFESESKDAQAARNYVRQSTVRAALEQLLAILV